MTSAKQWWRRAAAAVKDHRSLCLTRVAGHGGLCNSDMEAAIIRATSHDEHALDYKNARRVFAWARASPSYLHPLMWSLARRASRTRCWAVALKTLLLAHGLLLCSSAAAVAGRLPFDLSDFRDRSNRLWGHSAFVRAYFNFLDHRSLFLSSEVEIETLDRVEKLQTLLDLLLQIRPYADGMEGGMILEAMDCAMIEIFEIYSSICKGIAAFLVGYMDGKGGEGGDEGEMKRRGLVGIRILMKAAEQNERLSSYFELCRRLGVPNAAGLPPVERIPEEDIRNLEKLVMAGRRGEVAGSGEGRGSAAAVVTENWVVFDDEKEKGKGVGDRSPASWTMMVQQRDAELGYEVGDLIEL